jgi:hypothetical protein
MEYGEGCRLTLGVTFRVMKSHTWEEIESNNQRKIAGIFIPKL